MKLYNIYFGDRVAAKEEELFPYSSVQPVTGKSIDKRVILKVVSIPKMLVGVMMHCLFPLQLPFRHQKTQNRRGHSNKLHSLLTFHLFNHVTSK